MASKTQICNLALAQLGVDRITSLTDNTTEAKLCNTLYDDVVDEVLIEGPWSRAIRRKALSKTSNTPVYEFDSEFQLPTDPYALRVLSINNETLGQIDHVIESDKLYIDADAVSIKYIARLTNAGDFGTALTRAIVARLVAELAYPITGSVQVASSLHDRYEQVLARMLAVDGQQGSAEKVITTDLTDVR